MLGAFDQTMKHLIPIRVILTVNADDCSEAENAALGHVEAMPLTDGIESFEVHMDAEAICKGHCGTPPDVFEEVYYEIESQTNGATDEWVNSGWGTFDTVKSLNESMAKVQARPDSAGFEHRGVRVTITREVL
jgi:hypothetical protein